MLGFSYVRTTHRRLPFVLASKIGLETPRCFPCGIVKIENQSRIKHRAKRHSIGEGSSTQTLRGPSQECYVGKLRSLSLKANDARHNIIGYRHTGGALARAFTLWRSATRGWARTAATTRCTAERRIAAARVRATLSGTTRRPFSLYLAVTPPGMLPRWPTVRVATRALGRRLAKSLRPMVDSANIGFLFPVVLVVDNAFVPSHSRRLSGP